MTPEPSAWTKFTWHGVDITVTVVSNTISAAIVAAVASLTWELKNKRETKSILERDEKLAKQTEIRERRRAMSDALQRLTRSPHLFPEMLTDIDVVVLSLARDKIRKEEPFLGFLVWWQSSEADVRRVAPVRPGDTTKEAIWLGLKAHLGPMAEAVERLRSD